MRTKFPQCAHIARKRGVYHYRRRLPVPFQGEITLSLGTRRYREAEHLVAQIDASFGAAWRRTLDQADKTGTDLGPILRRYLKETLDADLQRRMDRPTGHPVYAHWWEPGDPGTAQEADVRAIRDARASLSRDLAENSPKEMQEEAERLLRLHGLPLNLSRALATGLIEAAIRGWDVAERRTLGTEPLVFTEVALEAPVVASPPPTPVARPAPATATPIEPLSFDTLLRGFAGDKGWAENDRNRYDRERTLKRFEDFLGHDDAARVTKADAVRWKEDMQARNLSAKTQRNDISEMKAIWDWARRNGKLPDTPNPFAGISPPKPKAKMGAKRPFTPEEAVTILTAARQESGFLRWAAWVCCLTGARIGEVAQAHKSDVAQVDGVWAIRLHEEPNDEEEGTRSLTRIIHGPA